MNPQSSGKRKHREKIDVLQQALGLVWRCAPGWTALSLVFQILQGIIPLVTLYLTKLIVDGIGAALGSPGMQSAFSDITGLVLLAAAAGLFGRLCSGLAALVQEQQSWAVGDYVQSMLHSKSIELDLSYYENPAYFDTLHSVQREAPYRPNQVVSLIGQLAQSFVSLAAMLVILIRFHWAIVFLLLPVAVPGLYAKLRYSRKLYELRQKQSASERESWYYSNLLTGSQYAKEVRLFGLGSLFIGRYRTLRQHWRHQRLSLTRQQIIRDLIAEIMSSLLMFAGLGFAVWRALAGNITLGDLVMYWQAFQRSQSAAKSVLGGMNSLYENSLFLTQFYDFLRLEAKIIEPPQPRPFPRPVSSGFQIRELGFSYPGSKRQVLEGIHFDIKPGEHVALVGENGSGKTTLVKLLCRLYEPDHGRITIDGFPLAEFSPAEYQRHFSVVFQDYVNYYLTARENIWLGDKELAPDDERIITAAAASGADPVLRSLPQGYDTRLGRLFAGGEELSVGEWQKVALARAFIRDADIVILDEPTSAMDARAEYRVFELFRQLSAGKMAIFISHRLASARIADRILVLEHGRIVEQGSHDELMKQQGAYYHLFSLQAKHYRQD